MLRLYLGQSLGVGKTPGGTSPISQRQEGVWYVIPTLYTYFVMCDSFILFLYTYSSHYPNPLHIFDIFSCEPALYAYFIFLYPNPLHIFYIPALYTYSTLFPLLMPFITYTQPFTHILHVLIPSSPCSSLIHVSQPFLAFVFIIIS